MSGIGPRCAGRPQCRCPCHAEATRPCTTTTALIGSYSLIHSFNNYAMGTVARPFHRVPAPVPEHPQRPGAALRLPHPSEAAARTLPRRARVTRIPVPASTAHERPRPHALPAAGPPASAPLRRFRPAGFVGRGRRASVEASRPGFRDRRRARRWDLRAGVGGSSPPPTHLRRVRTERPALSRLKPLGPPHTPQCPRCLLVLDRPPIALSLVHLKGLWARAARSLKGAARSRVSVGTRSAWAGGDGVPGAETVDHLANISRKVCGKLVVRSRPSTRLLYLITDV